MPNNRTIFNLNNKKSLSSNRSIDSYQNRFLRNNINFPKLLINHSKRKDSYNQNIIQKKKKVLGFFHTDNNFYPKEKRIFITSLNKGILSL